MNEFTKQREERRESQQPMPAIERKKEKLFICLEEVNCIIGDQESFYYQLCK